MEVDLINEMSKVSIVISVLNYLDLRLWSPPDQDSPGRLHCGYCSSDSLLPPPPGPALPMATVDIKNPEINTVSRFHGHTSHINNMVSTSFNNNNKKEKKVKGKKGKKLTKADIGTPSNFQ